MPIRRPAELHLPAVEIGVTGLTVYGFNTKDQPVCSLVVSATGVDVYRPKGKKPIRGFSWEEILRLAEAPREG